MNKETNSLPRRAVILGNLALFAYYLLLAAMTVVIVCVLFIQMSWFTVVVGSSMEPTLHNYQLVFGMPDQPIERGDIVTAYAPGNDMQRVIKRVVGMPGDEIFISSDGLVINGVKVYEGYLTQDSVQYTWPWETTYTVTLLEDEYFLLGDNRLVSLDSRSYGPVTADRIVSVQSATPDLYFWIKTAVFVIWMVIVVKFSAPIENKLRYNVQRTVLRSMDLSDMPQEPEDTEQTVIPPTDEA